MWKFESTFYVDGSFFNKANIAERLITTLSQPKVIKRIKKSIGYHKKKKKQKRTNEKRFLKNKIEN